MKKAKFYSQFKTDGILMIVEKIFKLDFLSKIDKLQLRNNIKFFQNFITAKNNIFYISLLECVY